MRIIQVVNTSRHNAASWYALTLSRLLRNEGHDVLVVALPGSETGREALEAGLRVETLELNTLNPIAVPSLYTRMRRLAKAFSPHIVNCHKGEAFLLWGLLRLEDKKFRLVRTRSDQSLPRDNPPNRLLHRHSADAIIVTNSVIGSHFRDILQTPKDKIWVVYGGVDPQRFRFDPDGRRKVRAEFGFGADDFVIGLPGRFGPGKGQREIIRGVASLRHDFDLRRIRLLLLGFEAETSESQVRAWLAEHGIDTVTVISGPRQDMPACLSALDAAALPSISPEAIARSALELMACDCPTIASDTGVLADLFSAKALVPPGDVPALTVALARLARHEHFRLELKQHQRGTISQLTEKDFLLQTVNVYQSLLR